MTGESMGINVNVQIRSMDKVTGNKEILKGHNRITVTGLGFLADYLSAHFNFNDENYNKIQKDLIDNLPAKIAIGSNGILEQYRDRGVKEPIVYSSRYEEEGVVGQPIYFDLSNGGSTMQSALSGSLQGSVDGYNNGITISYVAFSNSTLFEKFETNHDGVIIDDNNHEVIIRELALMSKNNKCWARIGFENKGLKIIKNRVYDVLWNINLVSINTQLKELNS